MSTIGREIEHLSCAFYRGNWMVWSTCGTSVCYCMLSGYVYCYTTLFAMTC